MANHFVVCISSSSHLSENTPTMTSSALASLSFYSFYFIFMVDSTFPFTLLCILSCRSLTWVSIILLRLHTSWGGGLAVHCCITSCITCAFHVFSSFFSLVSSSWSLILRWFLSCVSERIITYTLIVLLFCWQRHGILCGEPMTTQKDAFCVSLWLMFASFPIF